MGIKGNLSKKSSQGGALGAEFEGHIMDRENPHDTSKEQIGLGNVENIAQAPKKHTHNGADILDGSISKEKLAPNIEFGGEGMGQHECLAEVYGHWRFIYALLGFNLWDGGQFFMKQDGRVLDGGLFDDIQTGLVDCGGLEIPQFIGFLPAIDGGGFDSISTSVIDGGIFGSIGASILDGGRY